MSKKMLTHFEKRLLEERKRVLKELGNYNEAFNATPQSADAGEGFPLRLSGRTFSLAHR